MFNDILKFQQLFIQYNSQMSLLTAEDSYERAEENALKCVADNVTCDLSPIPGIADSWHGPNNV